MGAVSGGAALAASGYVASSVFGGVAYGLGSAAATSPILGLGNHFAFGDAYSFSTFATDLAFGGITGGIIGGLSAPKGTNIWSGAPKNYTITFEPLKMVEFADKLDDGSGFFNGTRYSVKVMDQLKVGDFHSFPESVTAFEKAGSISTIKGGDGIFRKMLTIPGTYNERIGHFEFIKDANGEINHRFFNSIKKINR